MGKCCSAKYICGLTEFIEDVVGGGGGGGTPGAPVNSVQYNSAGAFAGNANLTYDGTSLKVTGQIQFNGTSNLYPMFKASSATTTELQARLADDSDLTEFRAKFLYAGATTGAVRMNAAGQGIAVLTNNAGNDLARLCLGGSTALFPALKRNGTFVEVKLADDSAFTGLNTGGVNVNSNSAQVKLGSSLDVGLLRTAAAALQVTDGASGLGSITALGASITPAWSGTGTATTPLLVNVTADPGPAAAASKLLDLQLAGTSQIGFRKDGLLQFGTNQTGVYLRSGVALTTMFSGTPSIDTQLGGVTIRNVAAFAFGSGDAASSPDLQLFRDAADTLAQRRTTNAQKFSVYNTFTDASNYERGVFDWKGTSNTLRIGTEAGGTGVARAVSIVTGGTERLNIGASGGVNAYGNFTINSGNLIASGIKTSFSGIATRSDAYFGFSGTTDPNDPVDAVIRRPAANILGITNGSTGPGKLAIDNVQGTNLERLKMEWNTNVARIGTEKAGTGTARDLAFITDDTVRMVIYGNGGINTGGNALTAYKLQQTSSRIEIQAPETPASASAAGNTGEICWDANYIYVCIASGTWRRIAHATW